MAYIPDNGIPWTVEHPVKGNGKFHNTKIACKMTTIISNDFYNFCSYFGSKTGKLVPGKFF